jgi:hypothetical protein
MYCHPENALVQFISIPSKMSSWNSTSTKVVHNYTLFTHYQTTLFRIRHFFNVICDLKFSILQYFYEYESSHYWVK